MSRLARLGCPSRLAARSVQDPAENLHAAVDLGIGRDHRRHETDHVHPSMTAARLHQQALVLTLRDDGTRERIRGRIGGAIPRPAPRRRARHGANLADGFDVLRHFLEMRADAPVDSCRPLHQRLWKLTQVVRLSSWPLRTSPCAPADAERFARGGWKLAIAVGSAASGSWLDARLTPDRQERCSSPTLGERGANSIASVARARPNPRLHRRFPEESIRMPSRCVQGASKDPTD